MAFVPTADEVRNRFDTTLADADVAAVIEANAIQVQAYSIPDARRKQAVIVLSILDIQYDGLRRSSTGDYQTEKQYSAERMAILEELWMLDNAGLSGSVSPATPTVFTWYSATGDDDMFDDDEFTDGRTGTGRDIVFTRVTGDPRYFAIATSAPITSLRVGGELNQIASFPSAGTVTLAGHTFYARVSDAVLYADTSEATFMVA